MIPLIKIYITLFAIHKSTSFLSNFTPFYNHTLSIFNIIINIFSPTKIFLTQTSCQRIVRHWFLHSTLLLLLIFGSVQRDLGHGLDGRQGELTVIFGQVNVNVTCVQNTVGRGSSQNGLTRVCTAETVVRLGGIFNLCKFDYKNLIGRV